MFKFLIRTLALFLLINNAYTAFAQYSNPVAEKVSTWFLEERFLIADQNEDALLDRSELENFEDEFRYFLSDRNYELSDRNQDGFLSFRETLMRASTENAYLYQMQRKQARSLVSRFPKLQRPSLASLKADPGLVAQLFSNFYWMYQQQELVQKLAEDRAWTSQNPQVLVALHKNLRWLAANPAQARKLYRNRNTTQKLPQLLSWRADHKQFINSNTLDDEFYGVFFFPKEFSLR